MKVLYLTPRPPYPPHKGDQLIAWEQLKQLKQQAVRVYLVSFISEKDDEQVIRHRLAPYCEQLHLLKLGSLTKLFNGFKTFFNFKPLQVNLFTSRKWQRVITKLCADIRPDLIHVQTVRVAEYIRKQVTPKTIDLIDALSLNMERRARHETFYKKIILKLESVLLKKYEARVLQRFNEAFIVSERDKNYLPVQSVIVNPNGTYLTPAYVAQYKAVEKEKLIIFHGNMQYAPNVEAAYFFATEIWPELHSRYPDYQFIIVGKDPVKKIQQLDSKKKIVVTGFVEDIAHYLMKAQLAVYPLASGTGMQNKVVEALACGLPVVASPLALQGLPQITEREVISYQSVEELQAALVNLIESEPLRAEFARLGEDFVQRHYSWEKNTATLIGVWQRLV